MDWCWSWNSKTLATWWEELTHWKRPWCWERLKARGEGDDRGWWLDGISDTMDMSLSKLWELVMDRGAGVLQSMGSQRVRYDWLTGLNWIECTYDLYMYMCELNFPGYSITILIPFVTLKLANLPKTATFVGNLVYIFKMKKSPLALF